jgi:hypothetical protein
LNGDADLDRVVDEVVGLGRLLGDGVDGVLEDLAFSACYGADASRVGGTPDAHRRSTCQAH